MSTATTISADVARHHNSLGLYYAILTEYFGYPRERERETEVAKSPYMATLYYSLQVGEVHAGKNSFPGNYVDLGSGLTAPGIPEWQDAGTVNWTAYFNNQARPDEVWRHFTVSSETFDRPSDYGSVISWDTLFFVNQQTASFPKWAAVKVNDSFVIPSQYDLAPGWTSGEPTATESG